MRESQSSRQPPRSGGSSRDFFKRTRTPTARGSRCCSCCVLRQHHLHMSRARRLHRVLGGRVRRRRRRAHYNAFRRSGAAWSMAPEGEEALACGRVTWQHRPTAARARAPPCDGGEERHGGDSEHNEDGEQVHPQAGVVGSATSTPHVGLVRRLHVTARSQRDGRQRSRRQERRQSRGSWRRGRGRGRRRGRRRAR